jgi:hypothetical protein
VGFPELTEDEKQELAPGREVVSLDLGDDDKKAKRRKKEDFGEKVKAHIRYRLADGTIVPGSTTILGVLDKPALVGWANRLGLEGIDSRKYVTEAAEIGTLAHYRVACDMRGIEPDLKDFTPEQVRRSDFSIVTWQRFKKGKTLEPLCIEAPFISEAHRFGGTVDWYGLVDGEPTLIDCKTSSGIYDEHKAQTASYAKLLRENGKPVKRAIVLRLGRTEEDKEEPIENMSHTLSTREARLCWEIFVHAHAIYDLRKELRRKS